MHAFLIIGNTPQEREEYAKNFLKSRGVSEIIEIKTEKKHTISSIRELQNQLKFAPENPEKGRGVILFEAQLLTIDASHSFLKTLEEPQGSTTIVLTSPNPDVLLDTITSRTQIISLPNINSKNDDSNSLDFKEILNMSLGDRMGLLDKIGDRETALEFTISCLFSARKLLMENPERLMVKSIEKLVQTQKDLDSQVNAKIVIADFLLSLPLNRR